MWFYNDVEYNPTEEEIKPFVGFVYLITDLTNNKKYIGKKNLWSTRRLPPLRGYKRKRTKVTQSDWQDYYGSSEEVKLLVENSGRNRFKREILRLCISKGECSYYEIREQMVRDVLLKPDEYYNAFVGGKIHRKHVLKEKKD
jgi:hypothetical protein